MRITSEWIAVLAIFAVIFLDEKHLLPGGFKTAMYVFIVIAIFMIYKILLEGRFDDEYGIIYSRDKNALGYWGLILGLITLGGICIWAILTS